MKVYPAIDLSGGRVVRLWKGDFERETVYDDDAAAVARRFRDAGAQRLHVVDLDGTRRGESRQVEAVRAVCGAGLAVQVGGGIRDAEDVTRLLDAGASAVVVGSLAVRDPARTRSLLATHGGGRVVLALDCRLDGDGVPRVVSHGWSEVESATVDEVLESYLDAGAERVLCTDVERDGTLAGPNVELYRRLVAAFPGVRVLASGGVRDAGHLRALAGTGCAGVVLGRALYEGTLGLEDVLRFDVGDVGDAVEVVEGAEDATC